MSKVVLTKAQAEALQAAILEVGSCEALELQAKHCFFTGADYAWTNEASELNNLPFEKVARAILKGYEIKPEFNVGDWAKHRISGFVGTITKIQGEIMHYERLGDTLPLKIEERVIPIENAIPVTPEEIAEEKERRKWAAIGRELNEVKLRDVILLHTGECVLVSEGNLDKCRWDVKSGHYKRLYPAGSAVHL